MCAVVLLCCSNYIDRTNLAFASVQLNADIGLSPSVYGLGSGMFFISYACKLSALFWQALSNTPPLCTHTTPKSLRQSH